MTPHISQLKLALIDLVSTRAMRLGIRSSEVYESLKTVLDSRLVEIFEEQWLNPKYDDEVTVPDELLKELQEKVDLELLTIEFLRRRVESQEDLHAYQKAKEKLSKSSRSDDQMYVLGAILAPGKEVVVDGLKVEFHSDSGVFAEIVQ